MMKERAYRKKLTILGCIVVMVLSLTSVLWAKDWHELSGMDDTELKGQIAQYQKMLDQDPSDYQTIKGMGVAYHMMATRDAEKYAPKAVEFLSKALEMNKGDCESMCYLGSAMTMMAKTTWNPMKKISYVNNGTGLMDEAIKKAPDNVSVRMTRAINSRRLPSYLERGPIALTDFEYLTHLIEKHPEIPTETKKMVYMNLAELYDEEDDQTKAGKFRRLAGGL